jgi:hypothetical protein
MALPKLNTSKFLTTIPSTGQEVEYRPYLVKEEKVLMMALETKDQAQIVRAVAQVIRACVTENINTDKLTMFDVEYVFLQLRGKSSGEIIDLKLPCDIDTCKHVNDFSVDISEILPPVIEKLEPIELTPTVSIQMRWPGVKDLSEISTDELNTVDGATRMFAKLIVNIFEEDEIHSASNETQQDLITFVESLNSAQFQKLTGFLNDLPTLVHHVDYKCNKCNNETKIELKGLQSFFI